MDIDLIMKLSQRRSEVLAELARIDEQLKAAASAQPKAPREPRAERAKTLTAPPSKGPATGDARLPYGTTERAAMWAQQQNGPFTAYHVCKELGIDPRHEPAMQRRLSVLASEGKIDRLTDGTANAQAVFRRKALAAVAS